MHSYIAGIPLLAHGLTVKLSPCLCSHRSPAGRIAHVCLCGHLKCILLLAQAHRRMMQHLSSSSCFCTCSSSFIFASTHYKVVSVWSLTIFYGNSSPHKHPPGSSHERQHVGTDPWQLQLLSATSGTLWYSFQLQVRDRRAEQPRQWRSWKLSFLFSHTCYTDNRKGLDTSG